MMEITIISLVTIISGCSLMFLKIQSDSILDSSIVVSNPLSSITLNNGRIVITTYRLSPS